MKKTLFIILFFFTSYYYIHAQTASIEIIGKLNGDSVTLRWAPSNAIAWKLGNKYGYNIYRYSLRSVSDSLITEKQLIATGVKPLPYDDWEPLVKNDKYAAIAAQALYGESFEVTNPGANPMAFMDQMNEQESRFGFSLYAADLSARVASAMGLRLLDKLPNKDLKWVYRVELMENPTNYTVTSSTILIDPNEKTTLVPPDGLKAEFGDYRVQLSWASLYDYGSYIAYIIERSDDGGKTYKKRSEIPMAIVSKKNRQRKRTYYFDSLEVNYKPYYYRIKGITPFGETGPPSTPVFGAGLGSAGGATAAIDSSAINLQGNPYIQWAFPEGKKQNLLGFKIGRSSKARGPFNDISELINVDQKYFIDIYPDPVNYYVVKAIGRDSITTESMPVLVQLLDSIPPAIPAGLKGVVDTTGVVTLNWKPNQEPDVAGYRVFRSNSLEEEFVQVTIAPVEFSDYIDKVSLETLTEEIYYKIIAIDNHDNPSEYSPPVKLQRPDKIAPVAPVFTKWRSDEAGIYLEWIKSTSRDVVETVLVRSNDKGEKKQIRLLAGQEQLQDLDIIAGETYSYRLSAIDDAGLRSDASLLEIQAYDDGIQPIINVFKGKADRDKRRIMLSWEYKQNGVERFLIYRKKGEEPMRLMKAVNGDQQSFLDYNISINNFYSYRIKAVFSNDDETELSEIVKVEY
ncbi:MAG: fibronectin type III domain-containing protein [Candidatus Cyclobacteriaceae bacterium M2_1C_046]